MKRNRFSQKGSLLLEVLIAILIFSFGILSIVGLQAASIKSASSAKYRSDAAFLANEMIGRMWGELASVAPGYKAPTDWKSQVKSTLPGGDGDVEVTNDLNAAESRRVRVWVSWQVPGEQKHTFVSIAQINGAGRMSADELP